MYNIKFVLSGIPAVLAGVTIFRMLTLPTLVSLFISGVAYLVIYVFLLLFLKTFRKDDFRMMLAIEKKLNINLGVLKKVVMWFYSR
jgi:hypothetical protein